MRRRGRVGGLDRGHRPPLPGGSAAVPPRRRSWIWVPPTCPAVARAIMTTDTVPSWPRIRVGAVTMAGGGASSSRHGHASRAHASTSCGLSSGGWWTARSTACRVDTDTSTSDTYLILANGRAGRAQPGQIRGGAGGRGRLPGAPTGPGRGRGPPSSWRSPVTDARDEAQARRVAKAVLNSPLVKTAVHGADPQLGPGGHGGGRVPGTTPRAGRGARRLRRHRDLPLGAPTRPAWPRWANLRADEVQITVALGTGSAAAHVWGCDLSENTCASTPITRPEGSSAREWPPCSHRSLPRGVAQLR